MEENLQFRRTLMVVVSLHVLAVLIFVGWGAAGGAVGGSGSSQNSALLDLARARWVDLTEEASTDELTAGKTPSKAEGPVKPSPAVSEPKFHGITIDPPRGIDPASEIVLPIRPEAPPVPDTLVKPISPTPTPPPVLPKIEPPKPEPTPLPKPEPKPEPKLVIPAKPEPQPVVEKPEGDLPPPQSRPQPKPEAEAEPKPEPKAVEKPKAEEDLAARLRAARDKAAAEKAKEEKAKELEHEREREKAKKAAAEKAAQEAKEKALKEKSAKERVAAEAAAKEKAAQEAKEQALQQAKAKATKEKLAKEKEAQEAKAKAEKEAKAEAARKANEPTPEQREMFDPARRRNGNGTASDLPIRKAERVADDASGNGQGGSGGGADSGRGSGTGPNSGSGRGAGNKGPGEGSGDKPIRKAERVPDFSWYDRQIKNAFYDSWQQPTGKISDADRTPECVVHVEIRRTGSVAEARIIESSGHPEMDESVRKAIDSVKRVAPLPSDYDGPTYERDIVFRLK